MKCRGLLHNVKTCNQIMLLVMGLTILVALIFYWALLKFEIDYPVMNYIFITDKSERHYHDDNGEIMMRGAKDILTLLYPPHWKAAVHADEASILLKDHMLHLDLPSLMTCQDIAYCKITARVGSSKRKYVDRARISFTGYGYTGDQYSRQMLQQDIVIKSPAYDIAVKIACMKQVYDADFCGAIGNYLLMREVFLLRYLHHPGLISVLGYCLQGDRVSSMLSKKGVALVIEAGMPLSTAFISSLSWSCRLKVIFVSVFHYCCCVVVVVFSF